MQNDQFQYLTISFYTNIISLASLLLMSSIQDVMISNSIFPITAVIIYFSSHLVFLYFIAKLASHLRKSPALWVLGSMILFGNVIAYYRMKVNALMNDWI